MTPFLKLVADDLYEKLGGNFQDTCIIFPNKRASLFFNEYLWSNSEGKTMWTPEYTSISELFAGLSELTVGDPIYLVIKLWEVYKEKMQPTRITTTSCSPTCKASRMPIERRGSYARSFSSMRTIRQTRYMQNWSHWHHTAPSQDFARWHVITTTTDISVRDAMP